MLSFLGIDLGTSGIKCTVYNEDGRLLGKVYREYELYTPEPGIVELDPELVWDSFCLNVKELTSQIEVRKDPITALSISVSGDEALPIDVHGKPLSNTIMSMDKRGKEENDWINRIVGVEKVYKITGQPPAPLYALNRLLWFRNNRPDIFEKMYKFLCWEDFILFRLGAEPVTDYSVACRTLAFDIKAKKWSSEILDKVDIDRNLFSEVVPSGVQIGEVSEKIAKELGLNKGVKLVTGGFDQVCAALGAGVTRDGMASVGTGTMEVVQVCFDIPKSSKKMLQYGYAFCNHAIDGLYICLTLNFCGGIILRWYRDNFGLKEKEVADKEGKDIYDVMIESTKKSKYPVLFLPYFEGAQTPRNNPGVNGAILGLNLRTKKEDILKGMLEGITFDLKLNLEKVEETGIKIEKLRATGGGAKSDIWLQLKADITGKIIQKLDLDEGGCLSAAVLAGYGTGKFDSIEETISQWVKVKKEFYPDKDRFKRYENKYEQFLGVYKSIAKYKILH